MTHDELTRREERHRDLIEALGQLSDAQRAPADFLERVLGRAAQLPPPRRGWLTWAWQRLAWPHTGVVRLALVVGVLVLLIGAIPQYLTWLNAYVLGVSSETVHQAQVQESLWQKNFACATEIDRSSRNYAVIDGERVVVVTWVCPSGDVLVTLEGAPEETSRRSIWIPLKPYRRTTRQLPLPLREAAAADEVLRLSQNAAPMVGVLCQKWLPNRLIKRRVQLADGRCFDEIVNPRTGQVLSRQEAPCERSC